MTPPPRGARRQPPRPRPTPAFDPPNGRRRRRRRARALRKRRVVAILIVLGLLFVVAPTVGGGAGIAFGSSCDLASLRPVTIGQNSFVYAADGSRLGSIPAERNRQPIELNTMSPWLPKATIAIEDRRFYAHDGVDVEGIGRALWADVRAGKVVQGGSTLTQQLVRNLYPVSRERTVERKVKEACLAMKLDDRRSKAWILETYMNTVYYGNHAYGIEAAAQTYFSKHAKRLTLREAALLAGLPQAPSIYDPFRNAPAALARRDQVLRAMLDSRAITRDQHDAVIAQRGLGLKPGKIYTQIKEPYFFGYVRDELIKVYGATTVRSGGLRVYTTIDRRMQAAATKAMSETLNLKTDPAAALIAIDPATGAMKAMTAHTPGKKGNQFNLIAQARRQAGSTFKTFALAAAVEEGMNPSSTYYVSQPFRYDPENIGDCEDERVWCVETYGQSYLGSVSVASATLQSDNTVYAQLTLDVGPAKVAAMAKKLGVQRSLKPYPAIGLGAIEVSPLEMASAYATLAAGGIYSKPMAIKRVVLASGEADTEAGWGKPQRKRVISDGVAYEVTQVLEDNMHSGTGIGAYFGRPAAGKTGTTDNHADAWFCGYTPNLQATVWVGYPRAQVPMLNVHGIRVAGGTFPAQIWRLFMERAVAKLPASGWKLPTDWPAWQTWVKGEYAVVDDDYDYDYDDDGYDSDYDDDDGSGDDYAPSVVQNPTQAATRGAQPTTARPPAPTTTVAPPPPPVTTAPPPVTTAPPITTETIEP